MRYLRFSGLAALLAVVGTTACASNSETGVSEEESVGTAGQWLSFATTAKTPKGAKTSVQNTADGVILEVDVPGVYVTESTQDSENYQNLTVPDLGQGGPEGSPSLPFKGFYVQVLEGKTAQVVAVEANWQVVGQFNVYPQQPPQADIIDTPPPFQKDKKAYESNEAYPAISAKVVESGRIRGRNLAFVTATPFRYSPITGTLQVATDMKVHVKFVDAQNRSARRRSKVIAPAFEAEASRLVANYAPMTESDATTTTTAATTTTTTTANDAATTDGADYLIIAADAFAEAAQPLASWKIEKGYKTKLVPLSEIGTTATEIEAYIQNAYDTWSPAPTYVLLVGDNEQLPSPVVGSSTYAANMVSDLPYSTTDGSDYWPDIVVGRIAANTAASVGVVVNKLLTYDKTPIAGTWYENALIAAQLQNSTDCVADRWFLETAASVYTYLNNTVGLNVSTSFVPDMTCSTYTYRTSDYPHRPAHPTTVPANIASQFLTSSAGTAAVTTAINNGVGLVVHRDHGGVTAWGTPSFTTTHVNALTNGQQTPIVFSLNCLTGTFNYSVDSFAEALQKKANGGAVGIVAATEVSYSGYNDLIAHGIMTAMWPAYDSTHTAATYANTFRPAEAMNFGKHYMATYEGATSYTELEFNLFQWFGDPELEYRSNTPESLTGLAYATSLPVNGAYVVTGAPDGARVAISQDGQVLGTALSSNGTATVTVSGVAAGTPGTLTVTHRDSIPYQAELSTVTGAGTLSFGAPSYNCSQTVNVSLADTDLANTGTQLLTVGSTTSPTGVQVVLTESASVPGSFQGTLVLGSGTGQLPVSDGDTVTATYLDANNGSGQAVSVSAQSSLDCAAPTVSNVRVESLAARTTNVCWSTSETATGAVLWGTAIPLTNTVSESQAGTTHCVSLTGLNPDTTYSYAVSATDALGNAQTNNNGGQYFTFTTPSVPRATLPFSETFESATLGNYWSSASTNTGRIQIATTNTPYAGSYHLTMDSSTNGTYSLNELVLTVDLAKATDATLTFYTKEFSDETHTLSTSFTGSALGDGVSLSVDGNTWYRVVDLAGLVTSSWAQQSVNLSDIAEANNLTLTSTTQIKFQQYDDYAITTDGIAFDNIAITNTVTNVAPVASAGSDLTAGETSTVTLDGSASTDPDNGPHTLSYQWSQLSGTAVTLTGSTTTHPTFVAPLIWGGNQVLEFQLAVSDGAAVSQDTVQVVVTDNIANQTPVANAGSAQTVAEGTTVSLNGTGSTDPDNGPSALTYSWTQLSGTTVTLTSAATTTPSFVAPVLFNGAETLSFSLTVSDGLATNTAAVTVLVEDTTANQSPVADAGAAQTVTPTALVQLDASASYDPDNGPAALTYTWTQTAGTSVTLSDTTTSTPTFTAPTSTQNEVLGFNVSVCDGLLCDSAEVQVTVNVATNVAPVADAGDAQTVASGSAVQLDASESYDPDGDTISYTWTQTSGTSVVLSGAQTVNPTFTAPALTSAETMGFQVEVCDSSTCDTATVAITLQAPSTGCTAANSVNIGTQGGDVTVSASGCVMISQFPSWWQYAEPRALQFGVTTVGTFPIPFTWSQACSNTSGSATFTSAWQDKLLPGIIDDCPVFIDLNGNGNVSLRWY